MKTNCIYKNETKKSYVALMIKEKKQTKQTLFLRGEQDRLIIYPCLCMVFCVLHLFLYLEMFLYLINLFGLLYFFLVFSFRFILFRHQKHNDVYSESN